MLVSEPGRSTEAREVHFQNAAPPMCVMPSGKTMCVKL